MPDSIRLLALAEECERASELCAMLHDRAYRGEANNQSEIANIASQSAMVLHDAWEALRARAEASDAP